MSISKKSFLDCESRADLAALLDVEISQLTYFAYGKGKRYKTFKILKKSGGFREIKAPVGALKSIQRKLAKLLEEVYPEQTYVQGFVKGGSILKNATIHLNRSLVLNTDLADFFPSITAGRVIGLLRARPFEFNNEVASTIAGLTCDEGSLPQGAPTSPVISNMICLRMDKALLHLSKSANVTYSRYADDMSFSTKRSMFPKSFIESSPGDTGVKLGAELVSVIHRNYFSINPSKTRLQSDSMSKYVTGVKVNKYPNLSRFYVRQLRSMIHAWEKFGITKAQGKFSKDYGGGSKNFEQVVRGRLAHLKNIKGEDDLQYRRLYNRFIKQEGKGRKELPITEVEDLYSRVFIVQSGKKQGTGFILDGKWFITCDHVVEPGARDITYFNYAEFMPPLHRHINVNDDWRSGEDKFDMIALEPSKSDLADSSRILESAPTSFEVTVEMQCKIIGFPGYVSGSNPHITHLDVTALQTDKYGFINAHVDKKMISGSSGSPVLNDKNQVIGIVRRGTEDRTTGDDSAGYSFLPIQEIRRCIELFEKA